MTTTLRVLLIPEFRGVGILCSSGSIYWGVVDIDVREGEISRLIINFFLCMLYVRTYVHEVGDDLRMRVT